MSSFDERNNPNGYSSQRSNQGFNNFQQQQRHQNYVQMQYQNEHQREVQMKIQQQEQTQDKGLSEQKFQCMVCYELPDAPSACDNCGTIICQDCFSRLRSVPKCCPYCTQTYPDQFKVNKCLQKLINDFEIDCPLKCGKVIKRGDLRVHQDKYCPERLFECKYCGQELKKAQFVEHIKEHQDQIFDQFARNSTASVEEQKGSSPSDAAPVRRSIPVGWTRWYQSPPIQWRGIPTQEQNYHADILPPFRIQGDFQFIQFSKLKYWNLFHYFMGMSFFISRWAIGKCFNILSHLVTNIINGIKAAFTTIDNNDQYMRVRPQQQYDQVQQPPMRNRNQIPQRDHQYHRPSNNNRQLRQQQNNQYQNQRYYQ